MNYKKAFKKKLKEYKKRQQPLNKYLREEYYLESGEAEIKVDLRESELYNPLSVDVQRDLNPDIYSFVDEKVYTVPTSIPVRLQLIGVPQSERSQVEAIIKEHYDLALRDKKLDLRLNTIRSSSLFFIGGFMLALYFVLANVISNEVWYEIFSIIATVIVWNASEEAFISRHDLKLDYLYAAQIALADIEFIEYDSDKA